MEKQDLEAAYGRVWTTTELVAEYDALQYLDPHVLVRRRCDGVRFTFEFQHHPRFYFDPQEVK